MPAKKQNKRGALLLSLAKSIYYYLTMLSKWTLISKPSSTNQTCMQTGLQYPLLHAEIGDVCYAGYAKQAQFRIFLSTTIENPSKKLRRVIQTPASLDISLPDAGTRFLGFFFNYCTVNKETQHLC